MDAFVGVTAIAGGILLMSGLEASRFPQSYLNGTPFHDYVLPGLILASIVGGTATTAAIAMLRRPALGARASELAGAIMAGWTVGEVLILKQPHAPTWPELFYFAVGAGMFALGSVVRRRTVPRTS
jgi:hypothetical protein